MTTDNTGFTSSTLVLMSEFATENCRSFGAMISSPEQPTTSYAVRDNKTAHIVDLINPVVTGVFPTVRIEINNRDSFECGQNQVFFLEDGTPIMAKDLTSSSYLMGIVQNAQGWSNTGQAVLGKYAKWKYQVTGKFINNNYPKELISVSSSEYNQLTLQSGVVTATPSSS